MYFLYGTPGTYNLTSGRTFIIPPGDSQVYTDSATERDEFVSLGFALVPDVSPTSIPLQAFVKAVAAVGLTASISADGTLHLTATGSSAPVGAAPLVLDSFTRADDATHLGNSETGQAWAFVGATMGVNGGKATFVDGTAATVALLNVGQADVWLETEVWHRFADVVVRSDVGATSYFELQVNNNNDWNWLVAGAGGPASGALAQGFVAGDRLGAICYGASFVLLRNGVPILAYTDASTPRLTNTRFGFRGFAGGFNSQWDNLAIRKLDTLPQVICDGDSLTFGTGVTTPNQSYPDQLILSLSTYRGQPWIFRNFGIFGELAATMVANAGPTVDSLYSSNHVKNVVSVWAGTNDLNSAPGGAAGVYTILKKYWADRRKAGWQVLAFTLTPRSDAGASVSHEADRIALNTLIKSDTSLYDGLVDLGANANIGAAGASTNTTYFNADGLHLTTAGYGIVAGLVKTALLALP